LFIATLVVVVVLVIDVISGGMIRAKLRTFGAVLWQTSSGIHGTIFNSGYFASHRALADENTMLREQLARAEERAAAYSVLKDENDGLRALEQVVRTERGVTAPIVSSLIASPYGTFLIGAGANDVHPGDLVLTDAGFVAGTVSDVGSRTSLVNQTFAADASIDVRIAGASVVASGYGGGNARAILPRDITVKVGDAVVAPAYGGRAVGVVGNVRSDPANADQTVYIRIPVNLSSLRFVYVVTP